MLREIFSTEHYTILLVVCLIIIALVKLLFPNRFKDFVSLLNSFRYIKVYVRDHKFLDLFEGLLSINLIIGLSVFIILILDFIEFYHQFSILKLAVFITVLLTLKTLLGRLYGYVFKIEALINSYIFQKVSYKNFLGFSLIPINASLIYSWSPNYINITIFILFLILIAMSGLILFIKDNLKQIKKNWFYFILYLCALEILPYLLLYKLYTL